MDNLDIQPADAFKETLRGSLSLAWSPIPRVDLIGEFLTGSRTNKDLERGWASQIQLGGRFGF